MCCSLAALGSAPHLFWSRFASHEKWLCGERMDERTAGKGQLERKTYGVIIYFHFWKVAPVTIELADRNEPSISTDKKRKSILHNVVDL